MHGMVGVLTRVRCAYPGYGSERSPGKASPHPGFLHFSRHASADPEVRWRLGQVAVAADPAAVLDPFSLGTACQFPFGSIEALAVAEFALDHAQAAEVEVIAD